MSHAGKQSGSRSKPPAKPAEGKAERKAEGKGGEGRSKSAKPGSGPKSVAAGVAGKAGAKADGAKAGAKSSGGKVGGGNAPARGRVVVLEPSKKLVAFVKRAVAAEAAAAEEAAEDSRGAAVSSVGEGAAAQPQGPDGPGAGAAEVIAGAGSPQAMAGAGSAGAGSAGGPKDGAKDGVPEPEPDAFLEELILAMLQWEASTGQARAAMRRLKDHAVDWNDLRACMADDVAAILGERYPLSHERALRLRSVLQDIFQRQHGLSLRHLAALPPADARAYLESLEGLPMAVAQQVSVSRGVGLSPPLDERTLSALVAEKLVPTGCDLRSAARLLDLAGASGSAASGVARALRALSDAAGTSPTRDRSTLLVAGEVDDPADGRIDGEDGDDAPEPAAMNARARGAASKARRGAGNSREGA